MSSDRSNRPLKPTLASTRSGTNRPPLTPRIAVASTGSGTTYTTSTPPTRSAPGVASKPPVASPRVKAQEDTPPNRNSPGAFNVTPRSAKRRSRIESTNTSPSQDDASGDTKPTSSLGASVALSARSSVVSGVSMGASSIMGSTARLTKSRSIVGDSTSKSPPLVRSPGFADLKQSSQNDSVDSRFFHASDAAKQESAPKRPEPKKAPTFFYADGREDRPNVSPKASSPVLSAVSEKRNSGPWIRPEPSSHHFKNTPALSPLPPPASAATSFFPPGAVADSRRSPSPSKENIHLSYRKGASQIFGMRPSPQSNASSTHVPTLGMAEETARASLGGSGHRKSPSLSSIDSGNSQQSRRRSATNVHALPSAVSPLSHEVKSVVATRVASPPADLPSIDTSLETPATIGSPSGAFSPTRQNSEFAADARRERKVLDLEISNSSLLAINASLEREVRRQKAELKRFRRLSRAGRLSGALNEISTRVSDGLSVLSEEDDEVSAFGSVSGLAGIHEELTDSEDDGSLLSASEPRSPGAEAIRQQYRLAKDEKRLQVDLEKHKELLVQSQAMNQSLKRCMYATEEMIRDGKKALEYHVRVSDVKLGGRILTGHEDDDYIEVEDDEAPEGSIDSARGLLDVWRGIGRPACEGSEGSGDRDSGIEVDKPSPAQLPLQSNVTTDSGRPPEKTACRPGPGADLLRGSVS